MRPFIGDHVGTIGRCFYVFAALVFVAMGNVSAVSAVAFEMPPPISNKQKAHYDVAFTGSGSTCSESSTSDVASIGDGTKVSKDFSLGSDPKERRVNLVKALMAAYKLTPEQAAGPVGNFMRESSGTQTEAVKIPPDVNQGSTDHAPPNSSELGYSWAQWSGARKAAIRTFLKNNPEFTDNGKATDAGAFAYLRGELESGYKRTIVELKKQKTPEDAAFSFEQTFEGAGVKAQSERSRFARQAFNEYNGGGSVDVGDTGDTAGTSSGSSGCASSGASGEAADSAKFGSVVFPLKGSKKVVDNPQMFHDGTSDRGGHPYIAYDILAKPGVEIVAFAAGRVTYTSVDRCGGKFITIWNEEAKLGVTYMHMGSHIGMGKTVQPGEHVGIVGPASAGCGIPHLHVDVATDKIRQGCSRLGCTIQNHFKSIDKDLFDAYQKLPEN